MNCSILFTCYLYSIVYSYHQVSKKSDALAKPMPTLRLAFNAELDT